MIPTSTLLYLEAENELEPTVFQSTVPASPDIRDERV